MKLDFSMAKAGDKYIGELEFQRPDGEYDVWTIVKRLDPAVAGSSPKGYPIYLIGTATNSGLLSDYYYKPERGESESKSLEEINADLEVLAQDGESYMSRVKRIPKKGLKKNPPFYAHNLYEKKTHGLNLHQMRRLYSMVSRGNQKAITYARNVLGIPFSESPTQVKAVVYHHVRDLAERRGLKRNAPWSKVRNAFAKAGFQFHAYGKVDDPATGKKLYDYYKGDSLTDGQKKIIQSLIPEVEFGGSQSQYAPEIRRPVVMFPVKRGLRRNPGGYVIGYGSDPHSVYDVIAESKDGSRYIAFYMLTRSEAKKQAERLKRNLGEKTYIVYHPRDRKGNLLGHPSSLLKGTRYYNDFYKYVRKNPMEYDVLRDRFEVMGGPITDKMQSLLRKIYNMRDAGKSEAQLRPLIREYQRLKGLVTPLRSNPNRRRRRK